jgi:hypothetical protein
LGAYYVVVVIIFAQKLGAGTLVAIFVCAQLITSVLLDVTGGLRPAVNCFSVVAFFILCLLMAATSGLEVLLSGRVQAAMELSAAEQCPWWLYSFPADGSNRA